MTLRIIAIVGGFVLLGSSHFVKKRIQRMFRESEYYTKSLVLFEGYTPGVNILGKPIKVKNVDIWNHNMNWVDGLNARLAIPMKGAKEKGTLHSWASRENAEESWEVDKLDLEVKDQQWTFYINPKSKHKVEQTKHAKSECELSPHVDIKTNEGEKKTSSADSSPVGLTNDSASLSYLDVK